jgi:cold shock protein
MIDTPWFAYATALTVLKLDVSIARLMTASWSSCGAFQNVWRHGMSNGTVKWFNAQKGYGFIQAEEGGNDIFVHISAVQKAGLQTLNEGQRLSYEVERGRNGKLAAVNLRPM